MSDPTIPAPPSPETTSETAPAPEPADAEPQYKTTEWGRLDTRATHARIFKRKGKDWSACRVRVPGGRIELSDVPLAMLSAEWIDRTFGAGDYWIAWTAVGEDKVQRFGRTAEFTLCGVPEPIGPAPAPAPGAAPGVHAGGDPIAPLAGAFDLLLNLTERLSARHRSDAESSMERERLSHERYLERERQSHDRTLALMAEHYAAMMKAAERSASPAPAVLEAIHGLESRLTARMHDLESDLDDVEDAAKGSSTTWAGVVQEGLGKVPDVAGAIAEGIAKAQKSNGS